ncbi:hypothetical protein AALO_G00180860, partial [Alosa alosa]
MRAQRRSRGRGGRRQGHRDTSQPDRKNKLRETDTPPQATTSASTHRKPGMRPRPTESIRSRTETNGEGLKKAMVGKAEKMEVVWEGGNLVGERGNLEEERGNLAGERGNLAGERGNVVGEEGNLAGERGNVEGEGGNLA